MRITVPSKFYLDHRSRDCGETGVIVSQSKRYVTVDLDSEALADLKSDADYYADLGVGAFDPYMSGLVRSAEATLRRIAQAEALVG